MNPPCHYIANTLTPKLKIKKNYAKRTNPKKKKNRRGIYHLLKGIDTRGRIASCSLACNNDFRRVKTTP